MTIAPKPDVKRQEAEMVLRNEEDASAAEINDNQPIDQLLENQSIHRNAVDSPKTESSESNSMAVIDMAENADFENGTENLEYLDTLQQSLEKV